MSIEFEQMKFDDNDNERHKRGVRGRVVVGISAVMLIALAGGLGFGIGRSVDDSSAGPATAAGGQTDAATSDGDKPASTEPANDRPAVDLPAPTTPLEQAPVTTMLSVGPDTIYSEDSASSSEYMGSASGGWGYTAFAADPSDLLFERTTNEGLTLRAHLGETWDVGVYNEFDGWTPAPWCFESGQLRIAIGGGGIIDVGGVGWYKEPFKGKAVSWTHMGGSDGQPRWVVVVQTPTETTSVTATFEDGSTDSVAPQNGIALLTVAAPARPVEGYPGDYSFIEPPVFNVAFDGGPETASVNSDAIALWDDPEYQASCSPPPPALPEPGEQPADPVAAEVAIVDVMGRLYDPTQDPGTRGIYLDDDTGVTDAREQVSEGPFSDQADSASATIEELVFTAPNEAWFRYRVDTNGVGLSQRYGIAVLIEDTWLITRNTVCQDLSMAGGDCGGGWQPIYPPSMQEFFMEE